jgi:hypothetical protein
MTVRELVWSMRGLTELDEIIAYIRSQDPETARRVSVGMTNESRRCCNTRALDGQVAFPAPENSSLRPSSWLTK